jgi:hypothetical protein
MGIKGVGFLFGFIAVFLLVACLKQTGHARLAADCGLSGCALLAVGTGAFLLRRWRTVPDTQSFHEDRDVQFALAVLLLVLIAPLMLAVKSAPALVMLIPAAAIPARKFVRRLRRST